MSSTISAAIISGEGRLSERFQRVPVVIEKLVAVALDEALPIVSFGDRALLVVGCSGALVRHLQEKQIGELLDVVAVRHAVVPEHVAIVSELLDDGGCVHFSLLISIYSVRISAVPELFNAHK